MCGRVPGVRLERSPARSMMIPVGWRVGGDLAAAGEMISEREPWKCTGLQSHNITRESRRVQSPICYFLLQFEPFQRAWLGESKKPSETVGPSSSRMRSWLSEGCLSIMCELPSGGISFCNSPPLLSPRSTDVQRSSIFWDYVVCST